MPYDEGFLVANIDLKRKMGLVLAKQIKTKSKFMITNLKKLQRI